jgi:hypothetical protein
VDLSDALAAAAHAAGFDLDLDELVVVSALRTDRVLQLIHAAAQLTTTLWARALLADAARGLREIAVDEHGQPSHPDELAYVTNVMTRLEHAEPTLTVAVADACRNLHGTGLGLAWPRHDPPALSPAGRAGHLTPPPALRHRNERRTT